jgi:filamentous hemagglutinin
MASQGAVSVINNRGNLGAAFKDITTKDALKGYATGAVTAGFTSGVLDGAFGVTGDNVNKVTKGFNLSDWGDIGKFGLYSGAQGATHAIAQTAIQGGSFGDNLGNSLTNELQNALQGVAFNAVGGYSLEQKWADGSPQKVALHALVGGILSEASGQGFAVGAAAAGANEALSNSLSDLVKKDSKLQLAASQLVGLVAAGVVDGDLQTGANIAKNATAYNRQLHPEEVRRIKEKAAQLTAERGRPGFQDFTWEELLTIASDSQLDNSTANKYAALANKFAQESSRGNPLSSDFTQDMQVAQAAVTQMAQQGTPLTWNDGSAITAYGKPVLAFQATAEQKADSSLFGRTDYGSFGSMGGGNIALTGNQYGSKTALNKYSEISLFNGSSQRFDDLTERATSTVIPDLKTVTMLEFTPVGRAGAAGAAGAKAVAAGSGELLLVGGAKLVESKVIQANTTVQLSEAITLATGKVLPKGSVVTVSDDTMKVVYPNGRSEMGSYAKAMTPPVTPPVKALENAGSGGKSTVKQNNDVGNSFDDYVLATKLKGLDERGLIGTQERLPTPELVQSGKQYVKPDYTIYNQQGQAAAYADAKTGASIPFDMQARGLIEWSTTTRSKTLIYYTPEGTTPISASLLNYARQRGVQVKQVGVP